jgi:hypothetical protein
MKLINAATTAFCLTLIGTTFAPGVRGDEWNRKTTVTFGEPVEIPGSHLAGWGVLPAGSYVFKLMNSQSDRHIVQIFNEGETKLYATILCVPDKRLKATKKTVITFDERPVGEPIALRAWFYPGSLSGNEFVYPKARAMQLAEANKAAVPFVVVDIPVEVTELNEISQAPVVAAMKTAPIMTAEPKEVPTTPVVAAAEPATTLPATASNSPLIGMLGIFALSGAFLLGRSVKPIRVSKLV